MTLEVLQRGKVVSELRLPDSDFSWTIGKQSDCDVVLLAPDVSRRHAKLMRVAGVLTICDDNSRHGVAFNGIKTTDPMVFAPQDKVQIAGITFLRLKEDGSVKSEPPKPTPALVTTQKPQQPVSSVDSFDDEDDEQDVVPLTELLGDDFNDFRQLYTMYECMKDVHELHTEVINEMNLTDDFLKGKDGDDDAKKKRERDELLSKLEACVDRKLNLASRKNWSIPSSIPKPVIKKAVMNELVGYGPLSVMDRTVFLLK